MAGYWEDEEATAETIKDGWFHTGDLGRIDDKGNLYLVGRSKDVIVDSNGKNVYPDEIEDLYRDSPYIKDLSVVGLPDGSAEQVACAIMPAYDHDADAGARRGRGARSRSTSARCRRSCRSGSGSRSSTSGTASCRAPRSARSSGGRSSPSSSGCAARRASGALAAVAPRDERGTGWLLDLVATVSGKARGDVHLDQPPRRAGLRQLDVHRAGERARERGRRAARGRRPHRGRRRGAAAGADRAQPQRRGQRPAPARAGTPATTTARARPPTATSMSRRRSPAPASAGWRWRSGCSTSACSTRA